MQATSTNALEPVTSNQLLAWPPEIHETKRTPSPTHSAASDHASDQTEYIWINHKRSVTCKVARFEDKTNSMKKKKKRTRKLSDHSSDKDNDNKRQ